MARRVLPGRPMFRSLPSVVIATLVTACLEPTPIDTLESAVANGADVVINEFTAGNSGKIELYNAGIATADLSGWQVDDIASGGTAPKTIAAGTQLAPGAWFVIGYSGINTASADQVRLVDNTGVVRDAQANLWAGASTLGLCFGRQPDGGGWAPGAIACTLGATNGCAVSGACDDGDACTLDETIQPGTCTCGGGSVVDCDDGNACTADGCDSASGCAHAALPDGTSCGRDAVCSIGVCVAAPPPPPPPDDAELIAVPRRDHVLLRGVVITPAGPLAGEVLVEGDAITCVAASCALMQAAGDAAIVETRGIIFPGLIDAHNHILFDIFDETDWSPARVYTNHNQWTAEARYKALVDAKQYLNGESSPVNFNCELDKYGELKALVAGTTAVQGSANPADKACYGSLARTIDQSPNGLGADHVQTATIFPSTSAADGVCTNIAADRTDAYVIHIAEGVDATARNEFAKLGTITSSAQCLYAPETTIVHGTALGDAELTTAAARGMTLVWSPRSNVFLYGGGSDRTKTANIPLAVAKGITIALAPDWSIGGSQNLLDELRFADQVDNTVWGDVLTPRMLADMVTINAARTLGLGNKLGSIEVGKKADLMVIGGDVAAPYDALLAARPRDVRLVLVGGVALYGDSQLGELGPPAPGCEALDICGAHKFACVAQQGGTATNKLGQTFGDLAGALDAGLRAYDALDLSPFDFAPLTPLVRCESP